jgi:hypothetical protein
MRKMKNKPIIKTIKIGQEYDEIIKEIEKNNGKILEEHGLIKFTAIDILKFLLVTEEMKKRADIPKEVVDECIEVSERLKIKYKINL